MKHFWLILYMAVCVLEVKAQKNEPLIYGIEKGGLTEYNYRTGKSNVIVPDKFSFMYKMTTYDRSAMDAYNGRYFYTQPANKWQDMYVYEFNIADKSLDSFKLNVNDRTRSYFDMHYNPLDNSLIYAKRGGNDASLQRLDLSTGEITNLFLLHALLSHAELRTTFFNPYKNEYVFGVNNDQVKDSTICDFFALNSSTGNIRKLFSSVSDRYIVPFENMIWLPEENCYYGREDTLVVKFYENGDKKVVAGLGKNTREVYENQCAGLDNKGQILMDVSSVNEIDPSDREVNRYAAGKALYTEFHTFNKPFILHNGDTLQTCYGKSYRWLWNGKPIENNANEQKHRPRQCGYYSVEVTFTDGRVDTSEAVYNNLNDSKGQPITETFTAAYPNPFQDNLTIRYKTCAEENTYIQVYDGAGRKLLSQQINKLPAGEHDFIWDAKQALSYGIYFIKVFSGSELISTQKVLKL